MYLGEPIPTNSASKIRFRRFLTNTASTTMGIIIVCNKVNSYKQQPPQLYSKYRPSFFLKTPYVPILCHLRKHVLLFLLGRTWTKNQHHHQPTLQNSTHTPQHIACQFNTGKCACPARMQTMHSIHLISLNLTVFFFFF